MKDKKKPISKEEFTKYVQKDKRDDKRMIDKAMKEKKGRK